MPEASPLEATTVELPALGLSPLVYRGGQGPPLVFLHAAAGVRPDDPLLVALAERFEVVAPLHPGFRDLAEIDELRDVHDLALYHDDLLDALGLDRVAVVGHSFGGMVAAELAAHVPTRVSRLVLLAPVGLWRDDEPMADLFLAFPTDGAADLLWADPSSEVAQAAMAARPQGEGDGTDLLVAMVQGLATVGKYTWPLPDKGLRRRLHRVKAPTLVVWGAKDKLVPPSYADDVCGRIPDCRVEVLDDAGHMVPVERRDDVVRLVGEFLGRP